MKTHICPVLIYLCRHLFSSIIVEKLTQDYLWLSVLTRHPWNRFTRVQRLTCYMTLLLCNMVINVMFWRTSSTTAKRDEQGRGEPDVWCLWCMILLLYCILLFRVRSSPAGPLLFLCCPNIWILYRFPHCSHSLMSEAGLGTHRDLYCHDDVLSLDNHG